MEKENIGDLLNDYLEESLKQKTIDAIRKLDSALNNPVGLTKEKMVDLVSNANHAISLLANRNDDLYSKYEYHLFYGPSGYWVAQGREVRTTDRYE